MNNKDRRSFLGFNQPPLVSAADWLVEKHAEPNANVPRLNLADLLVVVPTFRAQNRLKQILVRKAAEAGLMLTPPAIIRIGSLPEELYQRDKLLASDLAQQIAWSKALEQTSEEEIACLTGRTEIEVLNDWQPLAKVLVDLHRRLANDIWTFRSVSREAKKSKLLHPKEQARWDVLRNIQERYYEILNGVGLWDMQGARNYAAYGLLLDEPTIRCRAVKKIVLVGTADLNRSMTEMLRQVAQQAPDQVTALVAATEEMADHFDEFGSLITQQWLNHTIPVKDEQILIVDQPADQAYAAAHFITNQAQEYASDETTIGVPDKTIIPQVERSLSTLGFEHRNITGSSLKETAPVSLMISCREYLRSQDYATLATLVRHPDMFRWLKSRLNADSWIGRLDEFQNENLPSNIPVISERPFGDPELLILDFEEGDESSQKRALNKSLAVELLNEVHLQISELLSPLVGPNAPIADWSQPWSQILVEVYGNRLMDKNDPQDQRVIQACDAVYQALGNHRQVPAGFGTVTSAIQALDWAIEAASEKRVIPPANPVAVELAGWLDLALDDAPLMVITGMNDEYVPESQIGHPFLPDSLCKDLGILNNDRRYARDAYALTVISSVRDDLLLVVGRRDEVGEPKKPSRLLFTDDDQVAARRAKAFFSYKGKPESRYWLVDAAHDFQEAQTFQVPAPSDVEPVNSLTVTGFRDYLKCPYRFYLGRVLKLKPLADDWREMNAGMFGDLIHDVLESFGKSEAKDETRPGTIREYLCELLEKARKKRFSGSRLPAVRIQIAQLRHRLEQFSESQAIRRKEGWQIVSSEEMLEHEFKVDGEPFTIRGKIDRVDKHEGSGRVAVWDYKSSDSADKPGPAHYSKKGWKDLQLPLYRHLVKEVAAVNGSDLKSIVMGYVLLPKALDEVGFYEADWNAQQLQEADNTAIDVIRKLRQGIFWPPTKIPPQYSQDYAVICQDNVFERIDIWEEAK